ncbi:MAG: transposase [Limnochordia bacterium]|jgi:transposase
MAESKFHKRFDPDFKKEIVRLVEETRKSPVEVAKDNSVSATTVRRWLSRYVAKGSLAFLGKGHLHRADEETRKVKKRIKDLEEENSILKKPWSSSQGTGDEVPAPVN